VDNALKRAARRRRIKERDYDEPGRTVPPDEIDTYCLACFGHGERVVQGQGFVVCTACGGSGRRGNTA
jgi:hypothetical protein